MKKGLLILLCFPLISLAQQTYVPDDIFEAHLEANGLGNGIPNDNYVTTSNISNETYLVLYNMNISDLTGIEDFLSLTNLILHHNQLTNIDLSNNTSLIEFSASFNNLASLDLSNNLDLIELHCSDNQLSSLNLSNNTNLDWVNCGDNQLTTLDLSNNINLIELACYNNQLSYLDLRNGNNINMAIYTHDNPNLTCINVDDSTWSTANWTVYDGNIDSQFYFSTNCSPLSIQELTTNKELLKVTDLLGRETKQTNQPLFYIYDDGTVEKKIIIK